MADGSVNFDTKIDTSGFQKGMKEIEKGHEKATDSVEKDAKKSSEKIEKTSDDTSRSVRSQVAAIAAEYRKSGMSSSDAMKKAWDDIKSDSKSSAESVKSHISGIGETSERIFKDSKDEFSTLQDRFQDVGSAASDTVADLDEFQSKFDGAMKTGVASVAALVGAIGGIGAAVWSAGTQSENAMNQVAAATGLTGDALKEIQDVTSAVYQNNFGDSMDDVANAVSTVYQQTELTGEALQTATENAFSMRDVFGYDVQESVRTAKALMDNFGISADDAYSLMVQGAQNGLDKNGDMLDTLNEYAVHYAQLGYSAEGFFGSLENGAESGAFSVDKIGDAMKEFGIRVKDSSDSTSGAFEALGLDATALQEKFAAGGDSAQEATQKVLDKLFSLDDQVARNQIGVDLFGTMWEDLGGDAVAALMDTSTEISATKDAMGQLNDVKYDSVTEQLKSLKRTAETEILQPFAKKLMPKLEDGIEWVADNLDEIVDAAKPVGTAIAGAFAVKKLTDFGTAAAKTVQNVSGMIRALPSLTNPLGLAVTGIATAVGGIAYAIYRDIKYADDYAVDLSDHTQALIDKQDTLNEKTEEQNRIREEWEENREDSTHAVDVEYEHYDSLVGILDKVVDQNGKIKEGYENRAKAVAEELSEASGIEIEIIDGQIQKYDELKNKIEEVLIAKKANALMEAHESSYMDAKTNLAEAGQTYSESLDNQSALVRRLQKAREAQNAYSNLSNYSVGTDEYYEAADRFVRMYGDTFGFSSDDFYNQGEKVYRILENEMTNTQKALDEADKAVEENLNNVIALQSEIQNYEAMQEAITSGDLELMEECSVRLQNNLETAETGTRESLAKQRDETYEHWKEMQRLYEEGTAGITEEMVNSGYDRYAAAQEECNRYESLARESADTTARTFLNVFSETLNANVNIATDSISNLIKSLEEAGMAVWDLGRELGMNTAAGFAEGAGNTLLQEEAKKAILNMAMNPTEEVRKNLDMHSPSRVTMEDGENIVRGYTIGIESLAKEPVISAEQMAQDVIQATQLTVSPWNSIVNSAAAGYGAPGTASSDGGAQTAGNWVFPVYLSPNTQVLDTIIISAKDRANAVSGGMTY